MVNRLILPPVITLFTFSVEMIILIALIVFFYEAVDTHVTARLKGSIAWSLILSAVFCCGAYILWTFEKAPF